MAHPQYSVGRNIVKTKKTSDLTITHNKHRKNKSIDRGKAKRIRKIIIPKHGNILYLSLNMQYTTLPGNISVTIKNKPP